MSGTYVDDLTGTTYYTFEGNNITVKVSVFGYEQSVTLKYKIEKDKIIFVYENQTETHTFSSSGDKIYIDGLPFSKVGSSSSDDSGQSGSILPGIGGNGNNDNTSTEEKYLSERQIERIADDTFLEFADSYEDDHSSRNDYEALIAYLPKALSSEKVAEHEYEFYYAYFPWYGMAAEGSAKVARITITALPEEKYEAKIDEAVRYSIKLTNVSGSNMTIRDEPYTSGSKLGTLSNGSSVTIYGINWDSIEDTPYIWFCISSDGYSKWVADGLKNAKDYYVFENGSRTKDMVDSFNY